MKKYNTAERLQTILAERNLKQIDLYNLALPICEKNNIKLYRSHISQYVNGVIEPSQEKIVILSEALHISPAWLMGFDVPMVESNDLPIVKLFNELNQEGQEKLLEYAEMLRDSGKYKKSCKSDVLEKNA